MRLAPRGPMRTLAALAAAVALGLVAADTAPEKNKKKPPVKPPVAAPKEVLKLEDKLTAEDPKDRVRTNSVHKAHGVNLVAGRTYAIDLVSKDFDAYLRLEDANGKELASDDDGGGNLNARILFSCERTGMYNIIATTFGGGVGTYALTVRENKPAVTTKLALKNGMGKVDAKLTGDDPTDRSLKNSHCKLYAVKMSAGKTYQIDLESTDFDSFLRLEDSTGKQLAQDDDSGGNLNARIVFNCTTDNTYRIIATTLFRKTGSYTLTVQQK